MSEKRRGILLTLATEGVVPVLGGCAGAVLGGPEAGVAGGVAGVAVGQAVEKAINFFGGRIVQRWGEWFGKQSPEVREQALSELANTPPEEVRKEAEALLDKLVLEPISQADREVALGYLTLLPGSIDRAMPRDPAKGTRTLPPTISLEEPQQLLSMLPVTLPPYSVGSEVPGTPYRVESLLGAGGFGAVYRASTKTLQHLPLAIKFCLDPTLAQALHRERENLERLMKASSEYWSSRIVRLYGYDLEHKTPYLVYEFVTGGDLLRFLGEKQAKLGRRLNPDEVFEITQQVVEALAFAHDNGLVHRDLKPANILVEGNIFKLADFGLGGVTSTRSVQVSRIGASTIDQLSLADQATLFRGAGTPLYMAPEQRRGLPPDPRHDLYSLGVMWFQLLVGDVSRELHPGWAKELSVRYQVPKTHIDLIECCVGWIDERPANARLLLQQMKSPAVVEKPIEKPAQKPPEPVASVPTSAPATMMPTKADTQIAGAVAERDLLGSLRKLQDAHATHRANEGKLWQVFVAIGISGFIVFGIGMENRLGVPIALLLGLFVSSIVGAVAYTIHLGRHGFSRDQLKNTVQMVRVEYWDKVASWGGESVLFNPDLVDRIVLKYSPPEEQARAALIQSLSAEKRKAFLQSVAKLIPRIEAAKGNVAQQPFPTAVRLFMALVVGGLCGLGLALMYEGYAGPTWINTNEGVQYYNTFGAKVEYADYLRLGRTTTTVMWIVGIGGAIVVTAAGWFFMRGSWHFPGFFLGIVCGVFAGGTVGTAVGLIHDGFNRPYTAFVPGRVGWQPTQTFSSSGRVIDAIDYKLQLRRSLTTSNTAGISTGVVTLLIVIVLFHRWFYRQMVAWRERLVKDVEELCQEYPELAPAGAEQLMIPGRLANLVKGLK